MTGRPRREHRFVDPSRAGGAVAARPGGRGRTLFLLAVGLGVVALAVSIVLGIRIGTVGMSSSEVSRIVVGEMFDKGLLAGIGPGHVEIVWNIRFPRVLMAAVVGAGLSLAGVVMQAVVRNPLATPYTLGVSSGASTGATLAIVVGVFSSLGDFGTAVGAFIGALAASACVFVIAYSGRSTVGTVKLLLAGMAMNALCSGITNLIVSLANDPDKLQSATFWMMGGLTPSTWGLLKVPVVVVAAATLFFVPQFRTLNALLLDDQSALSLGIDVPRARKVYLVAGAALTGTVVAASGTIGFVGLIVPHVVRMIVGPDHRRVIPLSLLAGAVFLIWCDVVSRVVLQNAELPIGVVTSVLGGPFFIWLLMTRNYGFGDE